jgi:hypothetical protein
MVLIPELIVVEALSLKLFELFIFIDVILAIEVLALEELQEIL